MGRRWACSSKRQQPGEVNNQGQQKALWINSSLRLSLERGGHQAGYLPGPREQTPDAGSARLARYGMAWHGRDDDDDDDASRRYTKPRGTASYVATPNPHPLRMAQSSVKRKLKQVGACVTFSCFWRGTVSWPPCFLSSSPWFRTPNRTPSAALIPLSDPKSGFLRAAFPGWFVVL